MGPGVNKVTSSGSSVIVDGCVGVKVGLGVSVTNGVPVGGVVVGLSVLMAKKSGVKVAGKPSGVGVGAGELVEVGVLKKGMDDGNAEQPARREIRMMIVVSRFMKYLFDDASNRTAGFDTSGGG
jgi:hypothetical protein